jgi:hypothetical protein
LVIRAATEIGFGRRAGVLALCDGSGRRGDAVGVADALGVDVGVDEPIGEELDAVGGSEAAGAGGA